MGFRVPCPGSKFVGEHGSIGTSKTIVKQALTASATEVDLCY